MRLCIGALYEESGYSACRNEANGLGSGCNSAPILICCQPDEGYLSDYPKRRRGREAEGGGLLNRYTPLKAYRGFESLRLRQFFLVTY